MRDDVSARNDSPPRATDRELAVLDVVTRPGGSAHVAAVALGVSPARVRAILSGLYGRLEVQSAAQATRVLVDRLPDAPTTARPVEVDARR